MSTLLENISKLKEKVENTFSATVPATTPVNPQPIAPKRLRAGELITNDDINNYDKATWITLRNSYANKVFWLLALEIIALFVIIILVGAKVLVLQPWIVNIFSSAVLLQSFGLVKVIVKNLFDRSNLK